MDLTAALRRVSCLESRRTGDVKIVSSVRFDHSELYRGPGLRDLGFFVAKGS